jgi:flagellar hook-associated protein 3
MSSIVPIPTSRVGDYFVRQRLVHQVQSDDTDLFRLQSQISTGQRLQLPSDDAPAALRAISLQRLLAQKTQIQTNVQSNTTILTAADSTLAAASTVLNNVLGQAVGEAGTTLSDSARQDAVNQVDQALEALVNLGNTQSAGQYLFSGSKTRVQPYEYNGQYVQYNGNEGSSQTYVGLNRLFDASIPGTDAFGGISNQTQGVALDPQVGADTVLSSINSGEGIDKNPAISVSINTGASTVTSVIDLSKAVTLGDVARLIEQGAPTGTNITASINGSGLVLTTSSGAITVGEVGEGKAANELGIATPKNAAPVSTITGTPLNPVILKTTQLNSLLGTKAQAVLRSTGSNNDIALTASKNGTPLNDVRVVFANDGTAGAETADYDASDPNNKTLTVHIQSGFSSAAQVATAINAEGTFQATADYHDQTSASQAGSGGVGATDFGQITAGGSGQALDSGAGLTITNGGKTATIDTSGATTVEGLLNLIDGAGLGMVAEINSAGTGINVRSSLSGADLTIGENGGQLATQLGIRTYTANSKLADFNNGVGVPTQSDATKNDLTITARDGTQLNVNLSTAKTVQDVINLINGNAANNTGTTKVVAQLATTGNGIQLVDQSTATTGDLTVQAVEGSQAAEYLGFVPTGQTQTSTHATDANGNYVLQSGDRNPVEAESAFTTLIHLKQALQTNDTEGIGRAITNLRTDISRVAFATSDTGSRLQSLGDISSNLKDENVQLQSSLSDDMDTDMVQAISDLTGRQYSLQASLQTAASLLKLSLLNYI